MHPLFSVWLKPGNTIERVLAEHPRRGVWPLAILGGIASVGAQLIALGLTTQLLDWRIILGTAVLGAVLGVVSLYVNAWCFRWAGKMFGGPASTTDLRAVAAWGTVPQIVGLAVCLAVLVWLHFSNDAPNPFIVVLGIVTPALGLWSWIVILLMLARVQHFGFWRTIASGAVLAVTMLALAMSIRTFLFQPFNIPAGSGKPTLLIGDYIFASKYAYGYSRFSLPFSPPLFAGRILASEPQRGDVVVFRLPKDTSVDYIKRLIGLPGDRIQMIDGLLHINGQPVKRERLDDFVDTDEGGSTRIKQWRETLPNGVSYATLDMVENGFYDNTSVYTVPPGHYFMLGDHRDNSTDSRVLSQVGYVPFENLIGRAGMVFYSAAAPQNASQPATIRIDRIGKIIR